MRHKGILTKWNDERGFGFIAPSGDEEPVFVHISAFRRGEERPVVNRSVTYRLVLDEKAQRFRAVDVDYMASRRRTRRPRKGRGLAPVLLVVAAFFAGLLVILPPLEWQRVASVYGLVSLVTFALYGLDKRAARRGAWRTAEAHLHLLELFGGWPGALLAQRLFRHKTRKVSFRVVFVLAIIANLAALGWMLYAQSGQELRGLLGVSRVNFEAWGIFP